MVRVSSDDNRPIDFSRTIVRGDRYQIHLRLQGG
jgi:DNA-binding GntR family transcriptional regulator